MESSQVPPSPWPIRIVNAFRGIPTDEDLRKAYFWESRRRGYEEMERRAEERRVGRLQRLWRAQWYSSVELLDGTERQSRFAVVQGRRFLWWESTGDFDAGEAPVGTLFLKGHSGLTTPSPLEAKALDADDLVRTASLFGRGQEKQERVTLVLPSRDEKERFERQILFAAAEKID